MNNNNNNNLKGESSSPTSSSSLISPSPLPSPSPSPSPPILISRLRLGSVNEYGSGNGTGSSINWDDLLDCLDDLGSQDLCHQACQNILNVIQILDNETTPYFMKYFLENLETSNLLARKEIVRLIGLLVSWHKHHVIQYQQAMANAIFNVLFDSLSGTADTCRESIGIMVKYLAATPPSSPTVNNRNGSNSLDIYLLPCLKLILSNDDAQSQLLSRAHQIIVMNVICKIVESAHVALFRGYVVSLMSQLTGYLDRRQQCLCSAQVVQALGALVTHHHGGSASIEDRAQLLADIACRYLTSPDWLLRKASCELHYALVTRMSKDKLALFQQQSIHALEQCKYDKIKSVRELAATNISLYKSLVGASKPITNLPASPIMHAPMTPTKQTESLPTAPSTPIHATPSKIIFNQNQFIPSPLKKSAPSTPNSNAVTKYSPISTPTTKNKIGFTQSTLGKSSSAMLSSTPSSPSKETITTTTTTITKDDNTVKLLTHLMSSVTTFMEETRASINSINNRLSYLEKSVTTLQQQSQQQQHDNQYQDDEIE